MDLINGAWNYLLTKALLPPGGSIPKLLAKAPRKIYQHLYNKIELANLRHIKIRISHMEKR